MSEADNYKLLDHSGKVIAMGTHSQMLSFLKHHVPDGRYRIVRKGGTVEPDPDGVCLKARHTSDDFDEMTEAERDETASKGITSDDFDEMTEAERDETASKELSVRLRAAVKELQAAYVAMGKPKGLLKALGSVECVECYLAGWIAGEGMQLPKQQCVEPDLDGVTDILFIDPPYGDEALNDDDE